VAAGSEELRVMSESLDILFGLIFIAWWFVVLKLLSKYEGWDRLASKYALEGKFDGIVMRCRGPRGAIHIGVNGSGIYLAMLFCFRPFHKPLFVPWKDIKIVRAKGFFSKGYKLVLLFATRMEFFFSEKTFKSLAKHAYEKLKSAGYKDDL